MCEAMDSVTYQIAITNSEIYSARFEYSKPYIRSRIYGLFCTSTSSNNKTHVFNQPKFLATFLFVSFFWICFFRLWNCFTDFKQLVQWWISYWWLTIVSHTRIYILILVFPSSVDFNDFRLCFKNKISQWVSYTYTVFLFRFCCYFPLSKKKQKILWFSQTSY